MRVLLIGSNGLLATAVGKYFSYVTRLFSLSQHNQK